MKNAMQMKSNYQHQHSAHLEKILAALAKSADATLRRFTAQFFAKMPVSDLERFEPKEAVSIAAEALRFMEKRERGEPKIRIAKFTVKREGSAGQGTVIELLNDDMPFLVDSLSAELTRRGFTIFETIHPVFRVRRDKQGVLQDLLSESDAQEQAAAESLIRFEVSALPENVGVQEFTHDLEWVLKHVRAAVEDWQDIVKKAHERIGKLDKAMAHFDRATVAEVKDFLKWLTNRNFVFLGYAEYNFYNSKGEENVSVIPDSRLGILKITDERAPSGIEAIPLEVRHFLLVPQLIEITKSSRRSPVHRPVPMDYIGLKRFDSKGKVIGEARFLGLFTSNVYYQSADEIPLVRQKITTTLSRADFDPVSHDGKSLKTILEFLPRDEIFQMSDDQLFDTSMGILALEAKPGVRAFARKDTFERFVSIMIFVPREQFSTELRRQIQEIVEKAYSGTSSAFSTQITEAPLARLQLIVKTTPGDIPQVNIAAIEEEIAKRAYLWSELLQAALRAHHAEQKAQKLMRAYGNAFPQNYINRYTADAAVHDIGKIEEASSSGQLALELFKSKTPGFLHLKIYNPNEEIALSDILPLLENAGFRVIEEHPCHVTPQGTTAIWIRDFKLQVTGSVEFDLGEVKALLEEVLLKTWRGGMENDRFNALVLRACLNWRQVVMLRAYAKYLKQVGFSQGQQAIELALGLYPAIVENIVALFYARFDPKEKDREAKQQKLQAMVEVQLAGVDNAAHDIILRRYVEVMQATLRTNYFQPGAKGEEKPVLSFKFASSRVPELPKPTPFAEIFVYGTRIEGIHLRGGKVARGGLRWSDRHEDFRTEVLGLMKAQMVKNAVIVPVGSKGGFVVKQPPREGGRDAMMEEGIACYKLYLSGLLDITDNIVKGKVTPPKDVVRHDDDDPYLVVAADKGTATFSDIANGISAQYGFWLGDAFASGGSAGYDHKKMAITARGAWVSVTRHFREMNVDIGKEEFTVAGIGDMAGDVFGNGMLLSKNIRLVAAFNHMHIFLDPSPDAKAAFKERQRLFNLPRSTWKDYKSELISKGGGVFERSAKTIEISKEMQAVLGISKGKCSPDELIRAILLSPVDLLWNGGIGTYVKSEDESHEQVGDRANNAVRVNGRDLRSKVVGEGGNLGFTQRGRIEYTRFGVGGSGGRINTDAIDNSAGVDCSDHEVNIKIALFGEIARGKLTMEKRDAFLVDMTEEVATLVLKDNILQTQAISISEQQGPALLESQARLMHVLERRGLLDRVLEFLPSDKQIAELKAARKGLTRPSLAVLLAYSKMELYRQLIESPLPDEPYFVDDLKRYFPKAMQEHFSAAIEAHPLRREIIATVATNSLVNRAGISFFFDIAEDSGASTRDIVAAYSVARDAFNLRTAWKAIEVSSDRVSVATQVEMYTSISRFLERVTLWLLRNRPLPLDIEATAKEMVPAIRDMEKHRAALHSESTRSEAEKLAQRLRDEGASDELADAMASLRLMASAFDIISAAHASKLKVADVGKVYFALGSRLNLGWLRASCDRVSSSSYWDRIAIQSLLGDFYDEQRRLVASALAYEGGLEGWVAAHGEVLTRYDRFIEDLKSTDMIDIPKLMVALRHVKGL